MVGQIIVITAEEIRTIREVVIVATEKFGAVGQTIVIAVETSGKFYKAAARKEQGVVADGQNLLFREGGKVACIIRKSGHIGRNSRNIR